MNPRENNSPFFFISFMNEYLVVAKILKPHGLRGQFRVYSYTSFASKRYKKGSKLFLGLDNEIKEVTIASAIHKEKNFYILELEEFKTVEEVNPLQGKELLSLKDETLLKKDEYFYSDLVGCAVFDEEKNNVGTVESVEDFTSQITLKISKNATKGQYFVPFNDFFVKEIDIKNKAITIHVIEGLII